MTMTVDDVAIGAEVVGARGTRLKKFAVGRVCEQEGCRTVLSVYNSHKRCALHDFDGSLAHPHVPGVSSATNGAHPHIWHAAA